MIDLTADIEPNKSIGGILLGAKIDDYITDEQILSKNGNCFVYFGSEAIFVSLNNRKEKRIEQISALSGYKGKLDGKYFIGMPIKKILEDSNWYFRDWHGGFENEIYPKIAIYPELEDPELNELWEQADSLTVSAIQSYCLNKMNFI